MRIVKMFSSAVFLAKRFLDIGMMDKNYSCAVLLALVTRLFSCVGGSVCRIMLALFKPCCDALRC